MHYIIAYLNLVPVLILHLIKASVLCKLKKNLHDDCCNSMSVDISKYITETFVYVLCLYSEPVDNLQVSWYLQYCSSICDGAMF